MQQDSNATRPKRLDIQALRAIAVAAVVLDHLSGWPSGGFVGVDVFFVVSGYLISALLIREHQRTGRISMRGFYERRARRLFPAAAATIIVTLAATFALFPRPRFAGVLVDAGWSSIFLANWHFGQQGTDYFAKDGPVSPFQHFWSLAVEEQFYVVWPLVLIAVLALTARGGIRTTTRVVVAAVMTAIVAASFLFALSESATDPTIAYFSTFDRAWELGVGVLIAVAAPLWSRIAAPVGSALSWFGFVGIVAAVFVVDAAEPFPAPGALLPVLSTALVLVAGSPERAVTPFILRNRPVQYLGDISYSLYLWHFPVYIVTSYLGPDAVWFAYVLSAGIAALSYHAVEQPFLRAPVLGRRRWRNWRNEHAASFRASGVAALAIVAVAAVGLAGVRTEPRTIPAALEEQIAGTSGAADGQQYGPAVSELQQQITTALAATSWPTLAPPIDAYLSDSKPGSPTNRCADLDDLLPQSQCVFGPDSAMKKVVLVGDSVAAYERPALESIVDMADGSLQVANRAAWTCVFADIEISAPCSTYREQTIATVNEMKPDIVVLTNIYDLVPENGSKLSTGAMQERVATYLDRMRPNVGKFVFVTPPPQGKVLSECYRAGGSPADCSAKTNSAWLAVHGMYQRLAKLYDAAFVDVRPVVCKADFCPAFIGDHVVRQDVTHFAYDFAKTLGPAFEELFAAQGVPLLPADEATVDAGGASADGGPEGPGDGGHVATGDGATGPDGADGPGGPTVRANAPDAGPADARDAATTDASDTGTASAPDPGTATAPGAGAAGASGQAQASPPAG